MRTIKTTRSLTVESVTYRHAISIVSHDSPSGAQVSHNIKGLSTELAAFKC